MDAVNEEYLKFLSAYDPNSSGADDAGAGDAKIAQHGSRRYPASISLAALCASGDRGRIVFLCAEPGMGRTTLLTDVADICASSGERTKFIDMSGMGVSECLQQCTELARWVRKEASDAVRLSISIDNLPCGDEADAERQVRLLRVLLRNGANVYVSVLPEAEMMVEMMGEATCFWSYNLCIPYAQLHGGARVHDLFTRGIPALVEAYDRAEKRGDCRGGSPLADLGYQQAYIGVATASIRPTMMREEAVVRAALLLLGQGLMSEVEEVAGSVDADIWTSIARDAPLFGIDVVHETFCCAGASAVEGLRPIYAWLTGMVAQWPRFVCAVTRRLAIRGDFKRAAVVGRMCPDGEGRARVLCEWAPEFVDAGELGLVQDELASAHALGLAGVAGFAEAECLCDAVSKPSGQSLQIASSNTDTRQLRLTRLVKHLRDLLAGKDVKDENLCAPATDALGSALALCGRALARMTDGRLEEAFVLVVDSPLRKKTGSLVATLLEMEYVCCSLLMGIVPPTSDIALLRDSLNLLDDERYASVLAVGESLLSFCSLLAGRKVFQESYETQVHRAARMRDTFLRAALLFASALVDVRGGSYVRAHVRLGQTITLLESLQKAKLAKVAHLIDICVRLVLAEHVPRAKINSCRGAGSAFDKAVTILLAATSPKRGNRPVGAGHWDTRAFPRDIHWVLNLLMGDFGGLSQRIREVMPPLWMQSVDRDSAEVDAVVGEWVASDERRATSTSGVRDEGQESAVDELASLPGSKCIRINVLGGMEVRAGGTAVGNTALERRRAKSMLALLAAVPGHVAKRFTIMESVWPEYDYDTAHRCVYSATSVLRTEMCQALGDEEATSVVFSNRSDRTVLLNMDMVSCDVDAFEEKSRRVLDSTGDDRLIVALCRDIEDLYRGPLFVPPTDGLGIVGARARELQGLYVDAMVAGAEAAMRTDMKSVACRFARKAHEGDAMREDAVRVLLVALCDAGRQVEAVQAYERYVSCVVDVTRRPPSRGLRKVAAQLLGERTSDKATHRKRRSQNLPSGEEAGQMSIDFGEASMGDVADA